MQTPVYFVSLGPGDPELITLKALNILRQSHSIFYPATRTRQGEVISRAADILRALDIPESALCPFILPMSKDRSFAHQAYDGAYEEVVKLYDGKKNDCHRCRRGCGLLFVYTLYTRPAEGWRTDFPTCCRCARLYCGRGIGRYPCS